MVTAIQAAEAQLGVKYVFGGESPGNDFDCSGLVQYAYAKAGIKLPRTADQQYHATVHVSAKNARPGDLVYFLDPRGHAYHTGIYLGNGKFLEAPHTGDVVKIANVNVNHVVFGRPKGSVGAVASGQAAAVAGAKQPDTYISYGYSKALANSVPDIKNALAKAVAGNWDVQHFQDYLKTTNWWKQHSDTAKKAITLQKQDPAEYSQQIIDLERHVHQMAEGLGIKLTADQDRDLATSQLFQGPDDATLQAQLGALYKTVPGSTGGQAVTLDGGIKQLADQYGVPVTQKWVDGQVKLALTNGTGLEGATQQLKTLAKGLFPTLGAQIDAGQTVADIAQPYTAQMAQLLEIDPSTITLKDPTIQKALSGQLPSSTPAPKATGHGAAAPAAPTTLYDFRTAVRNDPRWDKTDNAKQDAFQMSHDLLQKFGATAI